MSSRAGPIDLSLPPATPSPAITPTTEHSHRQSCDRCHSQKLRCTPRGGSKTGACSRCFRHGTQCVYSLSRPKGRPSLHHYKGETVLAPSRLRRETVVLPLTPEDGNTSIQKSRLTYSCQLSAPRHASGTMGPCQLRSDPILASGPYLELMPETLPDHAPQLGVCSWDAMHAQYQPIDLSNLASSTPMDMQLGLHDSLLDLCMLGAEQDPHLCMTQQLASQPPYNPDTSMLSLVQLVPRLHALSNKSHELFENWELSQKLRHIDRPVPAIFLNNAVFNVIARWLLNPLGDTDDEWTNESANEGLLVELLSFSSKLTKATLALGEELGTRTNKVVCDNSVAQHLVVACHMLLLSSFGAVLGALQDGADAERHAVPETTASGLEDPRLAMVVQFCSYLLVRQCRVVDAYLQANSGPKSSAEYRNEGTEDQKLIQELKAQVNSQVAWFQRLWHGDT
ncbi:hypothetical protein IWW34DRAFT_622403 [Fusarium oxysporum f. sp. albedinis]|nr:hypothetical protein IWW34DRAFT_622403 [Fusarium oxysporum f. sp. albedinis]KAJ0139701.1 Uncharacterized protein HZ326_17359 [Fusarium oxysporum f. sp. albedinis]